MVLCRLVFLSLCSGVVSVGVCLCVVVLCRLVFLSLCSGAVSVGVSVSV